MLSLRFATEEQTSRAKEGQEARILRHLYFEVCLKFRTQQIVLIVGNLTGHKSPEVQGYLLFYKCFVEV